MPSKSKSQTKRKRGSNDDNDDNDDNFSNGLSSSDEDDSDDNDNGFGLAQFSLKSSTRPSKPSAAFQRTNQRSQQIKSDTQKKMASTTSSFFTKVKTKQKPKPTPTPTAPKLKRSAADFHAKKSNTTQSANTPVAATQWMETKKTGRDDGKIQRDKKRAVKSRQEQTKAKASKKPQPKRRGRNNEEDDDDSVNSFIVSDEEDGDSDDGDSDDDEDMEISSKLDDNYDEDDDDDKESEDEFDEELLDDDEDEESVDELDDSEEGSDVDVEVQPVVKVKAKSKSASVSKSRTSTRTAPAPTRPVRGGTSRASPTRQSAKERNDGNGDRHRKAEVNVDVLLQSSSDDEEEKKMDSSIDNTKADARAKFKAALMKKKQGGGLSSSEDDDDDETNQRLAPPIVVKSTKSATMNSKAKANKSSSLDMDDDHVLNDSSEDEDDDAQAVLLLEERAVAKAMKESLKQDRKSRAKRIQPPQSQEEADVDLAMQLSLQNSDNDNNDNSEAEFDDLRESPPPKEAKPKTTYTTTSRLKRLKKSTDDVDVQQRHSQVVVPVIKKQPKLKQARAVPRSRHSQSEDIIEIDEVDLNPYDSGEEEDATVKTVLNTVNDLSAKVLVRMQSFCQMLHTEKQEDDNGTGDDVDANNNTNVQSMNGMIVDGALALSNVNVKGTGPGGVGGGADAQDWLSSDEVHKCISSGVTLADYQLIGVNWMALMDRLTCDMDFGGAASKKKKKKASNRTNVNGVLADEMGLGKTVQTIAFLAWLKFGKGQRRRKKENLSKQALPNVESEQHPYAVNNSDDDDESEEENEDDMGDSGKGSKALPLHGQSSAPHLVVVPASVLENWMREFAKVCPDLAIQKYHGTMDERALIRRSLRKRPKGSPDVDVILTTFSYFSNERSDDREFLKKIKFDYMVVDEAHSLKNAKGKRYQELDKMRTSHRLLLTGTVRTVRDDITYICHTLCVVFIVVIYCSAKYCSILICLSHHNCIALIIVNTIQPIQNNPSELLALICFLMRLFKSDDKNDGGAALLDQVVSMESLNTNTKPKKKGDKQTESQKTEQGRAYQKLKQLLAPFILRRRKCDVLSNSIPAKVRKLVMFMLLMLCLCCSKMHHK
jgi:SNF2 family DNA or RNA helicase